MHFKSLRTFITLLVGTCILVVIGVLIAYSLFANSRSQALVESQTTALLESNIEKRMLTLAADQAGDIQRKLEQALTLARSLAMTNALMGKRDENDASPQALRREEMSSLARQTVVENPDLLDAFIGWEPNAFGSDAVFAGKKDEGYDGSGRFMPWWYRTANGSIEVLPLGSGMESQERDALGIRKGEYYLCVKETLRACIIDPHFYDYNGETLLVTSFNAPILVDGEFRGVAGVDISVDFIQQILGDANRTLYDGAGEMALVASRGVVSAYTGNTEALGRLAGDVISDTMLAHLTRAHDGEVTYQFDEDQGMIELYWPFSIGDVGTPWVLMIRLPESAVMAGLHDLKAQMQDQREADALGMTLMGLLIAGLGLVAAWL
ncbi:cache domain-containing protein, partial [Modicisalibacter xianhensis]